MMGGLEKSWCLSRGLENIGLGELLEKNNRLSENELLEHCFPFHGVALLALIASLCLVFCMYGYNFCF